MAWNRRDDGSNEHPKILALGSWEPDLLWQKAGVHCSKARNNGVMRPHELALVGHLAYLRTPAKLNKAARRLVEEGLWHDHATIADCARCYAVVGDLERGAYAFHDWGDCNPLREHQEDELTKFKAERARRLKNMPTLKEEIRQRDRGMCRYCGDPVTSGHDTRSAKGRVFDHVDPNGDNTLDNVVTSCRRCNGRKKDRTPAQAGMTLLDPPVLDPTTGAWEPCLPGRTPPPTEPPEDPPPAPSTPDPDPGPDPGPTTDSAGLEPGSDPGPTEVEPGVEPGDQPGLDPGPPSRSARDGSGRAGPGSGPGSGRGPGQGRAGLGLAVLGGAGSALAGSGLAGLVRAGPGAALPTSSTTEPNDASVSTATEPRNRAQRRSQDRARGSR